MKRVLLLFGLIIFILSSCSKEKRELIVYTSVDQRYSEPIFTSFEKKTGIHIKALYDMESSKAVGLAKRISLEHKNPKADIFWNGEVLQTALLANKGLLGSLPNMPKKDGVYLEDPKRKWIIFGGRLRVWLLNNEALSINKRHLQKAMAYPLYGTSSDQLAWYWQREGERKTLQYLYKLKRKNWHFLSGNAMVRRLVEHGELFKGLTDSDDAYLAIKRNNRLKIIIYKTEDNSTLLIPNTISLIKGARDKKEAIKFIKYIISENVQKQLVQMGWIHYRLDGKAWINKKESSPLPYRVKAITLNPSLFYNFDFVKFSQKLRQVIWQK